MYWWQLSGPPTNPGVYPQREDDMTDSSTTPNSEGVQEETLENNLPLVTYIMLHRIYDLLVVIGKNLVKDDSLDKLIAFHEKGYLLGPSPSYSEDSDAKE